MQDGIENEGEKLIRSPTLRISQEDEVRVLTCVAGSYFVPLCVIGTFSSASLPIMSSADVSGFTIFSM